jgi:predicted glycosyltransferase
LEYFDLISEGGDPLELAYVSDIIVGMTTMLLFEASLLGKSVFSIIPRKFEIDWLPVKIREDNCFAMNPETIEILLKKVIEETDTKQKFQFLAHDSLEKELVHPFIGWIKNISKVT